LIPATGHQPPATSFVLTRQLANLLTRQLAAFAGLRLIFIFCQEARPKTKVMTHENNELPRQNTQRNLAHFDAPFGILNIEWKKRKSLAAR
jgi:hypothetical protein